MKPLEVMAKAAMDDDIRYGTRLNKMRDDGLFFEVFYHEDPDIVSPVVVVAYARQDMASAEAKRLTGIAQMRAALLALAEVDLPEDVIAAGWIDKEDVTPGEILNAMLRAIAEAPDA
jgi:hypothetical protein